MIFLKKLETGQVTVGDVGVGAQWCLVVLVTSIRLPLPTDVTQWYISSSPRHSPTLTNFTLLNNTLAIHF